MPTISHRFFKGIAGFIKTLFVLTATCLTSVASGCNDVAPAPTTKPVVSRVVEKTYIKAFVGTFGKDFADDSAMVAGGTEPFGSFLIRINGEPVRIYNGGGTVFVVSQWFLDGENTFEVSGTITKPIYVKLGRFAFNGSFQHIVAKKEFTPSDESALTFKLDSADVPLNGLSKISKITGAQDVNERKIDLLFNKLISLINDHDGAGVRREMAEGRDLWWKDVYGENFSKYWPNIESLNSDKNFIVSPDTTSKPIYVFGSRSVLACGRGKDGELCENLISCNLSGKPLTLGRISFVSINDHWMIWDY